MPNIKHEPTDWPQIQNHTERQFIGPDRAIRNHFFNKRKTQIRERSMYPLALYPHCGALWSPSHWSSNAGVCWTRTTRDTPRSSLNVRQHQTRGLEVPHQSRGLPHGHLHQPRVQLRTVRLPSGRPRRGPRLRRMHEREKRSKPSKIVKHGWRRSRAQIKEQALLRGVRPGLHR